MTVNDDHEGTLSYNTSLFSQISDIEMVGSFTVNLAGFTGNKVY